MKLVHADTDCTIWQGNAADWTNAEWVDLVFTNPYGFMPTALAKTPAIIHQWLHRHDEAERWSHMQLPHLIGTWNRGREGFWVSSYTTPIGTQLPINHYVPEAEGWYPEDMVRDILKVYGRPGITIWDGFMGRGTIGKVAREMGMKYIGVEQLERHVDIATSYLGLRT